MSRELLRCWQEEVDGPIVKAKCSTHPWQNRAFWRRSLCPFILQRDPICKICDRAGSTCVDHIVPFISPNGIISWERFKDPQNLQGLCDSCHSRKTATEDGGFGHPVHKVKAVTPATVPTGSFGKQFTSSSIGSQKLNAALSTDEEIAELLRGVVENGGGGQQSESQKLQTQITQTLTQITQESDNPTS